MPISPSTTIHLLRVVPSMHSKLTVGVSIVNPRFSVDERSCAQRWIYAPTKVPVGTDGSHGIGPTFCRGPDLTWGGAPRLRDVAAPHRYDCVQVR